MTDLALTTAQALEAEVTAAPAVQQTLAQQQAAGLRALADMIEANPQLHETLRYALGMVNAFSDDPAVLAEFMRAGRRHGATTEKQVHGDKFFTAVLAWGPLELHVNAHREEVCERVVTGTREVVEEVPDPAALAAVPTITVTRVVEEERWECRPLLAVSSDTKGDGTDA